MKKLIHISIIVFLLSTMVMPVVSVNAQVLGPKDRSTYTLLEPLPCVPTKDKTCAQGEMIRNFTIDQYIEYVFKFLIAAAVFLSIAMIIVGGFQYMLSEAFTSKTAARERITNAILGLLAALASYLILATIDPRLVQINTQLQPIVVGGCTYNSTTKTIECDQVSQFNSKLNSDLNKITADSRTKVNALTIEIESKNKRISELEDLMDSSTEPAKYLEYDTELQKLKGEIKEKEAEKIVVVATGVGANDFKHLRDTINQRDGVLSEGEMEAIKLFKENIESDYNKYAEQLDSSGNHEAAQKIKKEAQFYLGEASKDQALAKDINSYKNGVRLDKVVAKENFDKLLKSQEEIDKDPVYTLYADSPELIKQYEALKTARKELIEKTLGTKK